MQGFIYTDSTPQTQSDCGNIRRSDSLGTFTTKAILHMNTTEVGRADSSDCIEFSRWEWAGLRNKLI